MQQTERPQVPRHLRTFCIFISVHHRENLFEEARSNHVVSNPALSKPMQMCQGFDMAHFDDIHDCSRRVRHRHRGAHSAVDAEGAKLPAEVEARDAGLSDDPGRPEGEDPVGDGGWVVGERPALDLAGVGVEGAPLDAARADVETNGGCIIRHASPSPVCGNLAGCARVDTDIIGPDPRDSQLGTTCSRGSLMFCSYRLPA